MPAFLSLKFAIRLHFEMDQPNKLPLYVPQAIRNANPQFSQLLDTITQHLTQEGERKTIHGALEQVENLV